MAWFRRKKKKEDKEDKNILAEKVNDSDDETGSESPSVDIETSQFSEESIDTQGNFEALDSEPEAPLTELHRDQSETFADDPQIIEQTDDEKPVVEKHKADSKNNKKNGLFSRFKERLSKTRSNFSGRLESIFSGGGKIDEDLLEEMEEILITSDLGVDATNLLLKKLRKTIKRRNLTNPAELKGALRESMLELLDIKPAESSYSGDGPEVILIVGVNGVGKTTTIGKLANRYISQGKKVLLAAGDTFRAAAGEQLEVWANRVGADIVRHKAGADPSAVVFDSIEAAIARNTDIVLVDTAGRLHTKVNLMEELKKINRVMKKKLPDAPHQTLLILDATTGQNALSQADMFNEATPITGLIMTKLDGTAKGGIVAAVASKINKPILFAGLGEQMEDLRRFDPEAFVEAIF